MQVREEVLHKSELSSWTILPEASSATSRAQVRFGSPNRIAPAALLRAIEEGQETG